MDLGARDEGRGEQRCRGELPRDLHVIRLDDKEVEFRFLTDGPTERRTVLRGLVVGLPADARELDRFKVVVEVVKGGGDAPGDIVRIRIEHRIPEVTLNDVFAPHHFGISALGGKLGEDIDPKIRDQRDWYRALQDRNKKS